MIYSNFKNTNSDLLLSMLGSSLSTLNQLGSIIVCARLQSVNFELLFEPFNKYLRNGTPSVGKAIEFSAMSHLSCLDLAFHTSRLAHQHSICNRKSNQVTKYAIFQIHHNFHVYGCIMFGILNNDIARSRYPLHFFASVS